MNFVPEAVVGGGMAGLLYSWVNGVPVFATGFSPPPLCSFLHDDPSSIALLRQLSIKPSPSSIMIGAVWNGEYHEWPSPPEAIAAYFKKTRMHEVEVTAFDSGKSNSSRSSLAPLPLVYTTLWQKLKLMGLLWEVDKVDLRRTIDGKLLLVGRHGHEWAIDRVKLACPPEAVGISEEKADWPMTRNVYDVFEVSPSDSKRMVDVLYLCDSSIIPYRVSNLGSNMILVEHAMESRGEYCPVEIIAQDVATCAVRTIRHLDRRSNFGFYQRKYELPENVELVGRAATGLPLLTHHLYKQLVDAKQ